MNNKYLFLKSLATKTIIPCEVACFAAGRCPRSHTRITLLDCGLASHFKCLGAVAFKLIRESGSVLLREAQVRELLWFQLVLSIWTCSEREMMVPDDIPMT